MRNRADHLHMNFANIANMSDATPLMGTITYCYVPKLPLVDAELYLISTGSVPSKSSLKMVNPLGKDITFPVGLFNFEAFGRRLDLTELNKCVAALAPIFCDELEERIREACTLLAKEHRLSVEKVMEHPAGGLRIGMKIQFDSEGHARTDGSAVSGRAS